MSDREHTIEALADDVAMTIRQRTRCKLALPLLADRLAWVDLESLAPLGATAPTGPRTLVVEVPR